MHCYLAVKKSFRKKLLCRAPTVISFPVKLGTLLIVFINKISYWSFPKTGIIGCIGCLKRKNAISHAKYLICYWGTQVLWLSST